MEIKNIDLTSIRTNPNNIYTEQNIIELADSIQQWGQLENATLYEDESQNDGKKYTLVGGHRRYLALCYLAERGLISPTLKANIIPKPSIEVEEKMLIVSDNHQRVKDKETKLREIQYANNYWNYLVSINQKPSGLKRSWIAKKTGYGERTIQDILSEIKTNASNSSENARTQNASASRVSASEMDTNEKILQALKRANSSLKRAMNLISYDDSMFSESELEDMATALNIIQDCLENRR